MQLPDIAIPGPARRAPVAAIALLVLAALILPSVALAQGNRVVRGVARDSSTGQPLAGALIEIRSSSFRATDRSDEEGNFRIRGVPLGVYQFSAIRIGFAESKMSLDVGVRDENLIVSMVPSTTRLDAFRVRGDISAIYGMVGTLPDLLPLKGARVQVLGADKTVTTDSTGGFFIPVREAGTYMVRMTREGYSERMFPIEVPRNRAVDGSRMLDPGPEGHPGLEVVYKDMDQRLRLKSSTNAALVPGAEVRRSGTNIIDGLRGAQSFISKGLRIADSVCLFVNGVPRPGVSPEAFRPDEVESIEVYGLTLSGGSSPGSVMNQGGSSFNTGTVSTGDRSNKLAEQWPRRASCGQIMDRSFTTSKRLPISGMDTGKAHFMVIWLRK
jgi:hypothetical protein